MDFILYSPIILSIGGGIYYFKKKDEFIENDDIEILDTDYDADCPIIFFDNNGNYYYVYK
jgi:hypothetical protein